MVYMRLPRLARRCARSPPTAWPPAAAPAPTLAAPVALPRPEPRPGSGRFPRRTLHHSIPARPQRDVQAVAVIKLLSELSRRPPDPVVLIGSGSGFAAPKNHGLLPGGK